MKFNFKALTASMTVLSAMVVLNLGCATDQNNVASNPEPSPSPEVPFKDRLNSSADEAIEGTKTLGKKIGSKTKEAARNAAAGVKRGVKKVTGDSSSEETDTGSTKTTTRKSH